MKSALDVAFLADLSNIQFLMTFSDIYRKAVDCIEQLLTREVEKKKVVLCWYDKGYR